MLGAMSDTEARASDDATPDEQPAAADGPAVGPAAARARRPTRADDREVPTRSRAQLVAPLAPDLRRPGGLLHRRRLRDRRARRVRHAAGAAASATPPPRSCSRWCSSRCVIPLALLVPRKTRRFAQFMFLGIVSTVLVVAVTAALVIWVMVKPRRLSCFSGPSQPRSRTPRRPRAVLLFDTIEEVPMKTLAILAVAATAALTLSACGGSGSTTATPRCLRDARAPPCRRTARRVHVARRRARRLRRDDRLHAHRRLARSLDRARRPVWPYWPPVAPAQSRVDGDRQGRQPPRPRAERRSPPPPAGRSTRSSRTRSRAT